MATAPHCGYSTTIPDIDAMFVACDLMAAGAIQAITTTGRRVPGDVCVVGFDDSLLAIGNKPTLTTMRVPVEDMATTATRMLLSGRVPTGYRQRFPVQLVERESTNRLLYRTDSATVRKAQMHVV